MKRLVVAVVFAILIAAGSPVFAQNIPTGSESEFYYLRVSLEKIWPYRRGYVVQYRRGLYHTGRAYLPAEWFTNAASQGEIIILPAGTAWPSLTVYYRNGEFSHVRLYVHRMYTHQTWGVVPQSVNIDSEFEGIESLNLQFR